MTAPLRAEGAHLFDVDTTIQRCGAGRYRGLLTDRWDRLGGGPLGGYTLAVALRAAIDAMGPDHTHPVAISSHFVGRAGHGPVDIDTRVVAAGRSLATATALLHQSGTPILTLTATGGQRRPARGRTLPLTAPPVLPPPEECLDPLEGFASDEVSVTRRVEIRSPHPHGWRNGAPSGNPESSFWLRLAGGRPADELALAFLVDAAAPAVLELGAAGAMTVQLSASFYNTASSDWLACHVTTHHVVNGHHDEHFTIFDCDGTIVAEARQHALMLDRP